METSNKKTFSKIGIFALIFLVVAIVVYAFTGHKKEESTTFTTEKVEKGNIQNSVTATGTIEPVTSVTVGTQVSGIVSKLYVDYNSVVKKGQVIAELDKANLLSQLNTAKANLKRSKAEVQNTQANLHSAQAALSYQLSNYQGIVRSITKR